MQMRSLAKRRRVGKNKTKGEYTMKLTVTKDNLVSAIKRVVNAVSSKITLPALSNILVEAEGDSMILTASDLELSIEARVPAMVFEAIEAAASSQSITLIDPMAGSGTFSLEAAYTANKLIPGICRDFALKHQPAFKEATWNFIVKQGQASSNTPIDRTITSDISKRAIEIIRHNVECSPLASIDSSGNTSAIAPQLRDFFSYTAKEISDECGDASPILVLNPPYGKRLDFNAPKLYTQIGRYLATLASELKQLGKVLTVAILAPKDDTRDGAKYTCTANLLHECPALSPEHNSAAKHISTSHGGFSLNVFIAKI